eukprot:6454909-Amphidinium_carterae.1
MAKPSLPANRAAAAGKIEPDSITLHSSSLSSSRRSSVLQRDIAGLERAVRAARLTCTPSSLNVSSKDLRLDSFLEKATPKSSSAASLTNKADLADPEGSSIGKSSK